MVDPPTNYFVCTLDEAAALNEQNPHAYSTINEFFDERALVNDPAVGFPRPSISQGDGGDYPVWDYEILTFRDLHQASTILAKGLKNLLNGSDGRPLPESSPSPKHTVALLCPSSPLFLLTWLSLMRMGYTVLLIAPQCQASAITHLCQSCDVDILLFDQSYASLALEVEKNEESALPRCLVLPFSNAGEDVFAVINIHEDPATDAEPIRSVSENDVAYLHHTSGTSTGLPKPIPQTHCAGIGVLPCLDGKAKSSFTTTPLYHGGVADCFRAWTSGAMIWLFPGKEVPITPSNVLESLKCVERASRQNDTPPVRYFSSVPYVLQQLASEVRGLSVLQSMEIVGVGGAALPESVGNELVSYGVNLISRFGSAECGFLMSSHRDYANDKEWQYLRSRGSKVIAFEQQEEGLAELVICPHWPHMAKRNRDDGSFATADLFVAHPTIPNAWKYHSRADSQLTLNTGKKFDPAPLEDAILVSPLLSDVLIFGNGKHSPGALLFRSARSSELDESELLGQVWPGIEVLNTGSQSHARILRSMLVVLPLDAPALPKSSKGTMLRSQAEKLYQPQIEAAYANGAQTGPLDGLEGREGPVPDDEVLDFVKNVVEKVVHRSDSIAIDADLFSCGVDSLACIQISNILSKNIMPVGSPALPVNIVYDSRTIERLAKHLIDVRAGKNISLDDEIQLMRDLVTKYGEFQHSETSHTVVNGFTPRGHTVILTGATGSLGAHILSSLRGTPSIEQIICFVRARSSTEAEERVNGSLVRRRLGTLHDSIPPNAPRARCLPAILGASDLGLSPKLYQELQRSATLIIHAAWAVNFNIHLRSFENEHIRGLRNLLDLALSSPHAVPPSFVFCSSVASVLGPQGGESAKREAVISESISTAPEHASELGYSRSKWVAEAICSQAHKTTSLKGKISVVRIGQLCGDTEHGVWNASEAWPTMLSSVAATGCLPHLDEKLGWLAVDLAARAVIEIGLGKGDVATVDGGHGCSVYHVLNPDESVTWTDMLSWIRDLRSEPFQVLSATEWIEKLKALDGKDEDHPAKKLLGLWGNAYVKGKGREREGRSVMTLDEERKQPEPLLFAMGRTKLVAPAMQDIGPITQEHFEKIWRWIESDMIRC